MPFEAGVPRLAPPTCVVVVPAPENDPTLRTSAAVDVAVRSTLKFAGTVAVAEVPIALQSCVNGVLVESGIWPKANPVNVPRHTPRITFRNLITNVRLLESLRWQDAEIS